MIPHYVSGIRLLTLVYHQTLVYQKTVVCFILSILQIRECRFIEAGGLTRDQAAGMQQPRTPRPILGSAGPFPSFRATSKWPKDIWPEPQDPEGSPSPPTLYPHPSCANRLQLEGSKEAGGRVWQV